MMWLLSFLWMWSMSKKSDQELLDINGGWKCEWFEPPWVMAAWREMTRRPGLTWASDMC